MMMFRAHRFLKDGRREPSIDGDRSAERHELRTTIARMLRHFVDVEPKARMPFERTRELACECFDLGIAKAGIEDQRVDVNSKAHGAMNVRFDIVVESIPLLRRGEVDETHSGCRTERGRLETGIGKAECAARRDF